MSPASCWTCAIAALACLLAAPASAQVLELGAGGALTVYDKPAVFSAQGATPIQLAATPRPCPSRHGRKAARACPRPASRARLAAVTGTPNRSALEAGATAAELSPDLVEAVAWNESRLRPGLVSRAGAVGEMQLMPSTARTLGVDPNDSRQNYRGGAAYLARLLRRYDGDTIRALAAYNAGPGAVDRYGGLPPYRETRAYVAAVLERMSRRAEQTDR